MRLPSFYLQQLCGKQTLESVLLSFLDLVKESPLLLLLLHVLRKCRCASVASASVCFSQKFAFIWRWRVSIRVHTSKASSPWPSLKHLGEVEVVVVVVVVGTLALSLSLSGMCQVRNQAPYQATAPSNRLPWKALERPCRMQSDCAHALCLCVCVWN